MTRLVFALVLAALVPLGLATKVYEGPAAAWVGGSAGGVLYVMFFVLLVGLIRPTPRPLALAAPIVLAATCLIEVTQLWRPPLLEGIRGTFVGRTLLGSQFSWTDFPHYALGAAIGWAIGRAIVAGVRPSHEGGHLPDRDESVSRPRASGRPRRPGQHGRA